MSPFLALFDNLGGAELVIAAVAALLVFGRKLPEVASQAAQQIGKFKRGLDDAWRQSGVEKEIREIKNVIPRDLSVTNVARQAARRFEERIAEVGDEAKAILEPPMPHEPIEEPDARTAQHDASLRAPDAAPQPSPPGTEARGSTSVPFRGPDPRAGSIDRAPHDAPPPHDASRGVSGMSQADVDPHGTTRPNGGSRTSSTPPGAPLVDRARGTDSGGVSSAGESSSEATA